MQGVYEKQIHIFGCQHILFALLVFPLILYFRIWFTLIMKIFLWRKRFLCVCVCVYMIYMTPKSKYCTPFAVCIAGELVSWWWSCRLEKGTIRKHKGKFIALVSIFFGLSRTCMYLFQLQRSWPLGYASNSMKSGTTSQNLIYFS